MMNRGYTPMAMNPRGGCACGGMRGGMNEIPNPIPNGGRCGMGYDRSSPRPAPMRNPREGVPCPGASIRRGVCGCSGGQNASNAPSCGGQKPCDSTCKRLMDQIRAVDFALHETVLYLDVYPNSCDALETYHKLKAQSEALRQEYEAACGPLTAFSNQSTTSWDWMSKPFPWEYDAD